GSIRRVAALARCRTVGPRPIPTAARDTRAACLPAPEGFRGYYGRQESEALCPAGRIWSLSDPPTVRSGTLRGLQELCLVATKHALRGGGCAFGCRHGRYALSLARGYGSLDRLPEWRHRLP